MNHENVHAQMPSKPEGVKRVLPLAVMMAAFALEACQKSEEPASRMDLASFHDPQLGKMTRTERGRSARVNEKDYNNIYFEGRRVLERATLPTMDTNKPPQLEIRYLHRNDDERPLVLTEANRASLARLYGGAFRIDYFTGSLRSREITRAAAHDWEEQHITPLGTDIISTDATYAARAAYRAVPIHHFVRSGRVECYIGGDTEEEAMLNGVICLAGQHVPSTAIGGIDGAFTDYRPADVDGIPIVGGLSQVGSSDAPPRRMSYSATVGQSTLAHIHFGQPEHMAEGGVRLQVTGEYGVEHR